MALNAGQEAEKPKGRRGRKGDAAGKERGYKPLREVMQDILGQRVTDVQTAQELEMLGLEASFANAISLAAVKRAAQNGELEAARFVRDTVGEKPTQTLDLGIQSKPVKALDLSRLSDAQLEALADRADKEE